MLHIAICDDEKDFVQYLTDLLNQYSKETGRDIKITPYYDGMELIEKYDTTIDLIFLDIRMKLVNGLHAAERIRQMDERVGIIFLTTLTQYGLEGYKYQATNYIIKPLKYARLKSELDKFVERSQKAENPSLVIANDTGKYKVPLKSIRYIETYNRNLMSHTEQEKIICYKSMKETFPSASRSAKSLWNVWLTIGEICYDVGISDFRYNFNGNRGYFSVSVLFMVM